MNIAIRNYVAASHLLEQEKDVWDTIVILDSDLKATEFIEQHSRDCLLLYFDDITSPQDGKTIPDVSDIEAALKFAENSESLLVTCRAGQSRSAAIAFSIACVRQGCEAAIKLLNPKRHSPNPFIIELASQVIDSPEFLSTYDHWKKTNSRIKLMDYVDEIEDEMDLLVERGARNRLTS